LKKKPASYMDGDLFKGNSTTKKKKERRKDKTRGVWWREKEIFSKGKKFLLGEPQEEGKSQGQKEIRHIVKEEGKGRRLTDTWTASPSRATLFAIQDGGGE